MITALQFRRVAMVNLCSNLASALLGIGYAIYPAYTPAWDVFGVIFFLSLFGNLFLVYLFDRGGDKTTLVGKRLNWGSYGLLAVTMVTMLTLALGNFQASATYFNGNLGGPYAIIFGSFFGLTATGTIISVIAMKLSPAPNRPAGASPEMGRSDRHRGLRVIAIGVCTITMGGIIYLDLLTLAGTLLGVPGLGEVGVDNGFVGLFGSMWGGFWCFIALGATLMLMKTTRRYQHARVSLAIGVVGLVAAGILFTPLVATVGTSSVASSAFG